MTLIVCLDDRGGMAFNHRRQSRDRVQVADMLREVGKGRLLCAPYSKLLFAEQEKQPVFSEQFLEEAKAGDFCFVEDRTVLPCQEKIKAIIIYRWNRTYPRDLLFDLSLLQGFHLTESVDFCGSSHEKITRERYEK